MKPFQDDEDAIYKSSYFYQNFKEFRFKDKFGTTIGESNQFYSIEFCDVFLRNTWQVFRHVSFIIKEKMVMPLDKDKKHGIDSKICQIGVAPVRCGRFVREWEGDATATTRAILMEIGRYRLCGNKRKMYQVSKCRTNKKPCTLLSVCVHEYLEDFSTNFDKLLFLER